MMAFMFTCSAATAAEEQGVEGSVEENLVAILDVERLSDVDILVLKNGDRLTGAILNESFSIRTPYAKFTFESHLIAGIDLEAGSHDVESIVTVNNNRFSGFIDDPVFVFELEKGPQVEVRREKLRKAVFRIRDNELGEMPKRQFIVLKNGDFFSGKVLNDEMTVSTTYTKVPVMLVDIESITLFGGENQLTEVVFTNGDFFQGSLETEDIRIELDLGPTIETYQDRIHVIYGQEGYVPASKTPLPTGPTIALGESEKVGYGASFEDGKLRIVKLKTGSPADKAGLRIGDEIYSVDGEKLAAHDAIRKVRDEIIAGTRQQAILGVQRGEQRMMFRLVK
jgi:hypothetical protein